MTSFLLLAQDDAGSAGAVAGLIVLIEVVVLVVAFAGLWKIFAKTGKPGWAAIVPIYNVFVLTEIAGKSIVWFILAIIPCTSIIGIVVLWIAVAERFGKGVGYGLGLTFLAPIFWPILGFGSSRYNGPPPQLG